MSLVARSVTSRRSDTCPTLDSVHADHRWAIPFLALAGQPIAAKDKLAADLPALGRFRGKLTSSAATLADALDRMYGFDSSPSSSCARTRWSEGGGSRRGKAAQTYHGHATGSATKGLTLASTEGRTGRVFDGVEVGDVYVHPPGKAVKSRRRGDALRTFMAWTRGHVPETGRTLPPQPRV